MRNQPRNLYRVYITLILAVVAACTAYLFQPATPASAQTVNCSAAYYIDHTFINGARWDMCWEHRNREGIVFYDIFYTPPNGLRRKILAQANLAQIHVPYDDNGARYHDVTDYGLGSSNLEDLSSGDCFNGTLLQYGSKDAICQQVSRRGFAFKSGNQDADGYVLSLFHVSPVGAYNYIVMWRFHDDGALEPTIGATGRLQRRGSNSQYGWPIRSNSTTGISHIHNYYWRLDFDLGNTGSDDVVEEIDLVANGTGDRRTLAVRQMTTEEAASVNPTRMRTWRIRDGAITNADGHAISYELEPLYSGHRDEGPSYEPWTLDDFYVTRYNSCENYTSHNPTSGGCADDVTDFVNGQSLVNQDLVLWYGLTFHHIPRDEDEPNMHAHWNGFMMSPRDVTARNPLVEGLTVANPGDQVNLVGETVNFNVSATDPEGDSLTYSSTGLPLGLTIDANTGLISGNPTLPGLFSVTVSVADNTGETADIAFNWSITQPSTTLFFDDFENGTGWTRNPNGTDNATTGLWERATPEETTGQGAPMQVATAVSGVNILVTEGTAGSSVGSNDVDSGTTSIRSPAIALPTATPIELSFYYYFAHLDNATSQDFFRVSVVGNTTTPILEELGSADVDSASWLQANLNLDDFAGQSIYLLVETADSNTASLIEAGIDNVHITTPLNALPTITNPDDQSNTVGDTVSLNIQATDDDGDSLTFSATGLPTGLTIVSGSGLILGNPTMAGTFNVTVTVSDGNDSASVSFIWTITDIPNTAPTITNPGQQMHTEGDSVNLTINANDADGDLLTFSGTGLPTGLTINNGSGQIQGMVTTAGSYNITVTVSDGNANVSTTFTWIVSEVVVNTCGPLLQEAEEAQLGGAFTIINDGSASGGQYIEVPNRTGNGSIGSVHQAQFCFDVTEAGTYRLLSWVWSPNGGSNSFYASIGNPSIADYLWATPQSTSFVTDYVSNRGGADPVEFYLEAGHQTITIYLREDGTKLDKLRLELASAGSNLPPTISSPGSQSNTVNSVINLPLSATDPENDTLSFSATGLPNGLTINASTGIIAGTLSSLGTYHVTVMVNDGNDNSASASFSWMVNDVVVGNCGPFSQEAEMAQLSGAFTVVADAAASGGQYIEVSQGTGIGSVGSPHRAEFCFNVAQAGTYKLRGTVLGPNGGSNSFYVTVDGLPATGHKWGIPTGTTYVDDFVSHNGADAELSLAAGDHTVIIYLREDGTRLDKLVLE